MQINFKKFFDDEDFLSGQVVRLINQTQQNINDNNNNKKVKEVKNVKQVSSMATNFEA
tara:strand:+ start:276 stop:449 length:174 start_codon:yes stop_codon:yes gene_type:complete